MKLSDGVEWGVHCASVLAGLPEGATLPGKALAEFHGVSESYLAKHLKALAAAGVFDSVSGPKGGFRLARPPSEITLLDIVEAIEGARPAFQCSEIRQRGPAALEASAYARPCVVNAAMLRAERAYRQALRAETLAAIVESVAETVDKRAIARGCAWLEANIRR